eukprot:TRINITY_DN131_c4_g1_i1.p1 TRINITY_DN131_c4_g1~~TRINITY_DN131_c4_g1_i1.p1  ORF type:complete len:320 (+),score=126.32 TRINITY_DN131_c4_g1_i1:33-992(+)
MACRKYKFMQVDAFTKSKLMGNPCAIIFDSETLNDLEMQKIANEQNLSETCFVRRINKDSFCQYSIKPSFALRFFTPSEEIPLAGHPTIATIFALVHEKEIIFETNIQKIEVWLELTIGLIKVEIEKTNNSHEITSDNIVITMFQKKPEFLKIHDSQQILAAFGLTKDDLYNENTIIQTVSTGTPQLMIHLKNIESLRKAQLNIQLFANLRKTSDFFSPHLFCLQGATDKGHTFARHFVPPGNCEDPFTGSASGAMCAYLYHYNLLPQNQNSFIAEQGHWMNRPGSAQLNVHFQQDTNQLECVSISGTATVVIIGTYFL